MRKTLCLLVAAALLISPLGCGNDQTVFKNESSSPYASQIIELIKREENALKTGDESAYLSCYSPTRRIDHVVSGAAHYMFHDDNPLNYSVFKGRVVLKEIREERGNILRAVFHIEDYQTIKDLTYRFDIENGQIYYTNIVAGVTKPKK